jgi:hypothetical protein
MRALAQLAAVMPSDHPNRAEVVNSLALGLKARNAEILSQGVMNKDKSIETLLLVNRTLREDEVFLRDTHSKDALRAVGKLVSEESRRGKTPLSPGEWGCFLEYVASPPAGKIGHKEIK